MKSLNKTMRKLLKSAVMMCIAGLMLGLFIPACASDTGEETTATRFECETAEYLGDTAYKTETDATYSSGGVYASSTNNVEFVYENLPESNKITLRCASIRSNGESSPATITVKLKTPESSEFVTVGTMSFTTTTTWTMEDHKDLTLSVDIPEGSSLSHVSSTGINYDYIEFSYEETDENLPTRYECETAEYLGDTAYKTQTDATYSSGGKYASNTNGVEFVYTDLPASNKFTIRCAAILSNSTTITVKLKTPESDSYETMGTLTFEPTTSWTMQDHVDLSLSFDIPEGSSVSHYCGSGVNYDFVEFSYKEPTEILTGRIEAETCLEDMETYGWNIQSDSNASGGTIVGNTGGKTFTYTSCPEFNRLIIPASCNADSTITVSVKTTSGDEVVLPIITHLNNGGWFMDTAVYHTIDGYYFPEGSTVSLKIGHGVNLDYLDFYMVEFENTSFVEAEEGSASGGSSSIVDATGASADKYISISSGTSVEYINISESNCIKMIYASSNNGAVSVEILENGKWVNKGVITFATVIEESVGALTEVYSDVIYIPEGAAVRITANCQMAIDSLEFLKQIAKTEDDLDETYLLAKDVPEAQGSTFEDIMALVGTAVEVTAGSDYTFTIPSTLASDYNTVVVTYHSENGGAANIGGTQIELEASSTVEYKTAKVIFEDNFTPGQALVFNTSAGDVKLDYLRLSYLTPAPKLSVSTLPTDEERLTVNLNGMWSCSIGPDNSASASTVTVPTDFDNTIPVPGFWDMASVSLGSYPGKSLWYKKVVDLPEDFDPKGDVVVRLQILRALYGRHIYINGTYVESFPYNFTYSHTDITSYLVPGENEIVIMLGSYSGQNSAETHVHTGSDGERKIYQPGITDNVNLIFTGKTYTKAVQVAPDIYNGKVEIQVKLEATEDAQSVPVTVNFYELGIITDGVGSAGRTKVGTYSTTADVTAGGQTLVSATEIAIESFSKDSKCWEPGNPYLYEIEVVLPNDTFTKRFGMKEFYFDATTKLPMLNGKVYYLRGTNIAPYRFYEDPDRGSYPWQEDWIRKVYSEFFEINWEIYRSHNGPMPTIWYEIADEMGMMAVDEYAIFGKCAKCTTETLLPEYRLQVEEKQTHPCLIYWDAQNEANTVVDGTKTDWVETGDAIRQLISERVDIAERQWDNGWSLPVDEASPVEYHPYPFISGNNIDHLETQDNTAPWNAGANYANTTNPKVVNEYASLWLNRNGDATSISKKNYDKLIPNSTAEQRFELYTTSTAWLTEFYRSGRNIAAIQQFTGLTYSKPDQDGATGDVFMPDISNPEIRPLIKDRLKSSFAPLGIILAKYSLSMGPGSNQYPLTLVNDYNHDIENLPVTFTVTSGETVIYSETRSYSIKEAGTTGKDIVSDTFSFDLPIGTLEDGARIDVKACYTMDGEEVYSLRSVTYDAAARSYDTSISQGKTVTVSSEAASSGNPKEYAVDGDTSTRWGGEYRSPTYDLETPWICIDLGARYTLIRSQIEWETAVPTSYEIQISDDGVEFETVTTVDAVVKNSQKIDFDATARYVKIQALGCATDYSISIYEWYLWGDPVEEVEEPAVAVNATTGKTVTVSSEAAAHGNPKEYAVDGDTTTRWGAQYRSPTLDITNPWICVDMGGFYDMETLSVTFESARPLKFYVQLSLDGENFTTYHTFENPSSGLNEYEISGIGRYLRIYADGCYTWSSGACYGMSIFELVATGFPIETTTVSGVVSFDRDSSAKPYPNNRAILSILEKGTTNALITNYIEASGSSGTEAAFELDIPDGSYDYSITKNGYLQHSGTLEFTDGTCDLGEICMIPGDIKGSYTDVQGDGVVDIDDFLRLLRGFSSNASKNLLVAIDINEDGAVSVSDLAAIKSNLGSSISGTLYTPKTNSELPEKSIDDTFTSIYFLGETDKNALEYECGEKMFFTVTLYGDGEVISAPFFKYIIEADDGFTETDYIEATSGRALIAASCSVPGYVRLRVYPCDSDKNVISESNISIFEGGACADFDNITQSYAEPADFDEFWEQQVALLEEVTLDETEKNTVSDHSHTGFDVYDVKIPCIDGSNPVSGYVSVPQEATEGSLKLRVLYQGYGVDSAIISSKEGYITFYINPHGIENGREDTYYSELKAGELSGFGFSGNNPPENSYFRGMILRDVQSVRWLMSEFADLWNGTDLEIEGGSMAAFQSTAVAALLNNKVTKLSISIPWMCDVGSETKGRLSGWRPSYNEGIVYYDTVNFAKRLTCPTSIVAGLGDYICPPSGITVLFKAMTCEKSLTFVQNKTHSYSPVTEISYTK